MNSAPPPASISRRAAIGRLATLLLAGAWPGRRLGAATGRDAGGESLRFVVLNDFHHADEAACDPWFAALFRQVSAHGRLDCVLGLGDLADAGRPESLAAVRRLAAEGLAVPFYAVPGNHDNDVEQTTRLYAEAFPGQVNHVRRHRGWQIVLLDTTEGAKWQDVRIGDATLAWLDATLPTLDPAAPTILATHFPLAAAVRMCPVNAEAVLARFVDFDLRHVFGGHFHGRTEHTRGGATLVTNACVARVRGNHDGTTQKGYWLVAADGTAPTGLRRRFVAWEGRDVGSGK